MHVNNWKWGIGSVIIVKSDGGAEDSNWSNGVPSTAADLGYQRPIRLSKKIKREQVLPRKREHHQDQFTYRMFRRDWENKTIDHVADNLSWEDL